MINVQVRWRVRKQKQKQKTTGCPTLGLLTPPSFDVRLIQLLVLRMSNLVGA